jgi:tetratricopeptide (TPR) repeat protein/NAD-dependent SIR2 family protein deacetylase
MVGKGMDYNNTDIKNIAETLRWAKDNGYSTAILIGAGMSISAGIPSAKGIMDEIKNKFPTLCNTCEKETYPAYMSLLAPAQRKKLIGAFIDNAKINIAHLYLGALVKEGYVDRILSTNFDPLVVRSLALFNIFPAVYDFAASQSFIPGGAGQLSMFHLHGQRDGFVLLNTEEELKNHSEKLKNVFHDVNRGRCWIVIGYSGENDPVFQRLGEIDEFQYKLFWIGHKDKEPAKHVMEKIVGRSNQKYGYFLKGYDADKFFLELAKELKLPEPQIISRPFSHLKEAINMITEYLVDDKLTDPTKETKKWIDTAIEGFEEGKGFESFENARKNEIKVDETVRRIRDIWVHDRFDQIDENYASIKMSGSQEANKYLAFALNNWGIALSGLAKKKEGKEADGLFKQSFEKYQKALEIKPDFHEALNNWGNGLSDLAKMKEGKEADGLFKQSFEKYQKALEIKPDYHEALNNWRNSIFDLAKMKEGKEADGLFKQSFEKYQKALEIKPDKHEALNNWGTALSDLAKMKEGKEADGLFKQSFEKYQKAENLKEGHSAYNLACLYSLKGNETESLKWLEKGLIMESTPSRSHILADSDMDNIKNNDEFMRVLNTYRAE